MFTQEKEKVMNYKLKRSFMALMVALAVLQHQSTALAAPSPPSPGGDFIGGLLQQVQDLVSQVQSVAEDTISTFGSQAGEFLSSIAGDLNLDEIMGELGQIDPQKMQEELLSRLEEGLGGLLDPHLTGAAQVDGLEGVVIADTVAQKTLGEEGQRQSQTNLEMIVETATSSAELVEAAADASQTDAQTAQEADDLSEESDEASRSADESLQSLQQQASEAQAATSSQDVLKIISSQTAENGSILSALSAQLGANGNQLGGLSNQLASNSSQNANLASLQAAQVQLNAAQATSLETLKQQGAAANLTLNQINEMQRGDRQAEQIASQGPSDRLARINRSAMRLMR
jgi:vacuolar-type H+-ATPase subunit I/STV1